MPVSASKSQELAARREVERELFTLGLTIQDVATAMKLDLSSVRNDFGILGGKETFPSPAEINSEYRKKIYRDSLLKYAGMVSAPLVKKLDSKNLRLESALANYLHMEQASRIAAGIEMVIDSLIHPNDPPEFKRYRELLVEIFGQIQRPHALKEFLEAIHGEKTSIPIRYDFEKRFIDWTIGKFRLHFSLPLGVAAVRAIDSVLSTLTPREERVIRKRFGLGFPLQTLGEMGHNEGLSGERIRQIEGKALRKLRHPTRSKKLKWFVSSEEALFCFFAEKFPAPSVPVAEKKETPSTAELLTKSIEELELSQRTYNCLRNSYIKTIGELVAMTEAELIRTKNFGQKSLDELKEIMGEMGLKLSGTPIYQTPIKPSRILEAYREGSLQLEEALKALETWNIESSRTKIKALVNGFLKGLTI
jgi:hypothetical protein